MLRQRSLPRGNLLFFLTIITVIILLPQIIFAQPLPQKEKEPTPPQEIIKQLPKSYRTNTSRNIQIIIDPNSKDPKVVQYLTQEALKRAYEEYRRCQRDLKCSDISKITIVFINSNDLRKYYPGATEFFGAMHRDGYIFITFPEKDNLEYCLRATLPHETQHCVLFHFLQKQNINIKDLSQWIKEGLASYNENLSSRIALMERIIEIVPPDEKDLDLTYINVEDNLLDLPLVIWLPTSYPWAHSFISFMKDEKKIDSQKLIEFEKARLNCLQKSGGKKDDKYKNCVLEKIEKFFGDSLRNLVEEWVKWQPKYLEKLKQLNKGSRI